MPIQVLFRFVLRLPRLSHLSGQAYFPVTLLALEGNLLLIRVIAFFAFAKQEDP
jgi:hypothetical protein